MELSDLAAADAISLEIAKSGMTQLKAGDWQVRFTIADIDPRLLAAPMGTRYACVLVAIEAEPVVPRERESWRDLSPTKQAAMRCKEPVFWAFLSEHCFDNVLTVSNEDSAASCVRQYCGVASRSDLDNPGRADAREKWEQLDEVFLAWRIKENA